MFSYNNQRVFLGLFAPVYGSAVWYLTSDLVPIELLSALQAAVIPLMVLSRVSEVEHLIDMVLGEISIVKTYF